ncbi:MAG: tetratricopeptide repeat protein [Chloroflexota bacterium]|nr:tetratricopeptide repeat protein [Chloroflexota bacterium]
MIKKITSLFLLASFCLGACNLPGQASIPETSSAEVNISVTSTVEPAPEPTLAPTSTPLPTPMVAASIEDGDQALFNGDWEQAAQIYTAALENSTDDTELYCAALLGLGCTHHYKADDISSLALLNILLDRCPDSAFVPAAHITIAQANTSLGQHSAAAQAYTAYLEMRPGLIDAYIHKWRGDALVAAGELLTAIDAYQAALASPRVGDTLHIEIKIANAYATLGDHNTALVAYQDIYARTTNDYTKAHLDYLIGQSYTALGQMDQAHSAYLDAVENYPLSYDSYQALILLVEAGYPVSELDRGLVDYFAGQYNLAIAAFDRYLNTTDEAAATAHYYKGLAYRALGSPETAIKTWDVLIQFYPDDERIDDAWDEKAYTQWAYLNQYDQAEQTLLDFVKQNPWHSRSPEILFDAARIAERNLDLERAANLWQRIPTEHPNSEYVPRAIFMAAIAHYRLGDYDSALAAFQRYLGTPSAPGDRAAAHFWMGKSYQAMNDAASANVAWEQTVNADPTGYYSERARDILLEREPFTPPLDYDLGFDPEAERAEAEIWMRDIFAIPAEIDLSGIEPLLGDPRLMRGTELWSLGLYDQASHEFMSLWQDIRINPMDNYRLANYLVGLGDYYTAIFAAREVLNLNQMDDAATMNAPIYFNHLRFGSYYSDLIIPIAKAYNFHPLFLFSVVRQESLFASWVQSSASARGLMQIIPSTGESIAAQSGWPQNYTSDDLYRPKVSLTFGADYLSDQRDYFDGDLYAALAAYNGGPGNAAVWEELARNDSDLFLEIIRFDETRRYVKGVFEIFAIYRRLYDRTP